MCRCSRAKTKWFGRGRLCAVDASPGEQEGGNACTYYTYRYTGHLLLLYHVWNVYITFGSRWLVLLYLKDCQLTILNWNDVTVRPVSFLWKVFLKTKCLNGRLLQERDFLNRRKHKQSLSHLWFLLCIFNTKYQTITYYKFLPEA